jgi:hypothetical protein
MVFAEFRAFESAGSKMLINRAMMPITTSNSTNVNPVRIMRFMSGTPSSVVG